ncbi:gamma-glutamylcyclotransferase [Parasteatoda tepidariorum]|uniref:gamma-glutamylcyclotransferase n=1 Tax=Parasteatoda tepidariorum TaxID=114398 RepID=UPI001C71B134|nr:gamma-glutamylcyclotransferase [Parasteatoda tepidariorum]
MSFLYFSYGSNMLNRRILINCPSAIYKCNAKLEKYQLLFTGYSNSWKGAPATIIKNEKDSVWGVVWEILKEHEDALNRQERGYQEIYIPVCSEEKTLMCKSYQMQVDENSDHLPSPMYKNVIIQGAKEHCLPSFYIQKLESIQDNGYDGKVEIPISNCDVVTSKENY